MTTSRPFPPEETTKSAFGGIAPDVIQLTKSEHSVKADYTQEHMAVLASTLAMPAALKRNDLLRLQPTTDIEVKRRRAQYMLNKLDAHRTLLKESLDSTHPTVRNVLRALAEGDYYELAELGVSDEYAWIDDILSALVNGAPFVKIETIGPYAAHHLDDSSELVISKENLPDDERAGLMLGHIVRDMTRTCSNFYTSVLLDDLTTFDGKGLTQYQRDCFVVAMGEILKQYGVIASNDVAGKDFILLRESEHVEAVDDLIQRLKKSRAGKIEETHDGTVTFYPTAAFIEKLALDSDNRKREFRRRGIALKRHGRPTCQALDAASYLPLHTQETIHLVILEKRFTSQQEKTYALVRALDVISQESYHNIFFDTDRLSPELITYIVCSLFHDQLLRLMDLIERMDEWAKFDPEEYASRNYGQHILSEDHGIIEFVVRQLKQSSIRTGEAVLVADVGSGPNFYPSMLLAPYVSNVGSIDLIEYGEQNLGYARSTIAQFLDEQRPGIWEKFEALMVGAGGEMYLDAFAAVCNKSNVVNGSIFSLPANRYDIITSYFVAESITSSQREFRIAIRSLAKSAKPGGLLVIAHMIGSNEWHAGVGTHFPSVRITLDDVEEAFRDADLSFTVFAVDGGETAKAREGYQGMAVVIAQRPFE